MIDGFRQRRRDSGVHPVVREHSMRIVVGGHTPANKKSPEDDFKPPEVAAQEDDDIIIADEDDNSVVSERAETKKDETTGLGEATDEEPVEEEEEETSDAPEESKPDKPAKHRRSLKAWLKSRTKKQWIIYGTALAVVLIAAGTVTAIIASHSKGTPVAVVHTQTKAKPAPASTTVASTLTGLQVDPSVNKLPVTGIMIENSTLARPQSGLDKAGVVFEAVAEGGITRFLTLWQDTNVSYVGPVRSVRPYYIQWALGFDAAIAHVGGSPEALTDMSSWHVKDLDQFYNGSSYQRISSRVAPHNVYTSIDQLNSLETKKGFGAPSFTGFVRKKEAPSKTPNATGINLTLSSSDYNVRYDYDGATNSYKRSEGGAAHTEVDASGATVQIAPKVVIALVMTEGIESDDLHTSYGTIGSGHMYVFQDGIVTQGTWAKSSNNAQFTFTDDAGKVIALNPGQTWITVVSDTSNVTYQ